MARKSKSSLKHEDCWNTIGVWAATEAKCERLDETIHCRNCEIFSQAGRNVFERKPPSGYLALWQKEIASDQVSRDKGSKGIMVFRLGKEWFSIPIDSMQEITEHKKIHRIPHNEISTIDGIVNVGGEVEICYSLFNMLGAKNIKTENSVYKRLVVVLVDGDRYVFPVSEVSGVAHYNQEDLNPVPSTLDEEKKTLLYGIINLGKRQVAALNIEKICQVIGRNAA